MIDVITCLQRDLEDRRMAKPTDWTKSLVITLPKKGHLQMCQNYRTFSLISHLRPKFFFFFFFFTDFFFATS